MSESQSSPSRTEYMSSQGAACLRDTFSLSQDEFGLRGMTYHQRTFGCQMNKHDSERVAGMLEALGMLPVGTVEEADLVVFMTCCVREAADVRLMGQVASLKSTPANNGRRIIAVGGCIGQRDGEKLVEQIPHIDVVFGTQNIAQLPRLIEENLRDEKPHVQIIDDPQQAMAGDGRQSAARDSQLLTASYSQLLTASDSRQAEVRRYDTSALPSHREQPWHAWVSIISGCNNFCSYCVVPYVRGREKSRPIEDIRKEVEQLVAEGVKEITLLGQNVNSYGRDLYGNPRFDEVLRLVGDSGVKRLRFATSHPKDLSDATIAAFAEVDAVMPQLHLPVQSGSNRILAAMNRNYTAEHYLDLIGKVRAAAGDVAFSTDIIVGFPGETEADFEATMELVRQVGYSQAFTFIYSRRQGTPAASMIDETPHELIQERFDRLVGLVQHSAKEQNQKDLDRVIPVLFEGSSKRDLQILTGKSPKNQTIHVPLPSGNQVTDYAGALMEVKIEEARTWYLRGSLM